MMQTMTAEQALEAGKNLDFAQVWSTITALGQKIDQTMTNFTQMSAQTDAQIRQMSAKSGVTDEQLRQISNETKEYLEQVGQEVHDLAESVKADHANVSGVGNSLGAIMESMFAANICPKFNAFGHTFTLVSNDQKYYENGKLYCEVDSLLENGKYVLAIEVKARCEMRDINKHLERLRKLRVYMDKRDDHRIVLGGIAAGSISDKLREIAEGYGLYIMVQNGDAVEILEKPHDFKEGTW
jgi:RecB family endonuclease NucS